MGHRGRSELRALAGRQGLVIEGAFFPMHWARFSRVGMSAPSRTIDKFFPNREAIRSNVGIIALSNSLNRRWRRDAAEQASSRQVVRLSTIFLLRFVYQRRCLC